MIFVHDFTKCMEAIEFGPSYPRFHAWLSTYGQKMSSFTEGKRIFWIQLYGVDNAW